MTSPDFLPKQIARLESVELQALAFHLYRVEASGEEYARRVSDWTVGALVGAISFTPDELAAARKAASAAWDDLRFELRRARLED